MSTWTESKHPRDSHGRFGHGHSAEWAKKAADQLGGDAGLDGNGHYWSSADLDRFAALAEQHPTSGLGVTNDPVLDAIAMARGFDAKPTLVGRLPDSGDTLYRGVSSAEYAHEFTHGRYFAGTGIRGNGTYTTTNPDRAGEYAAGEATQLLTMKLAPGSRVETADSLDDQIDALTDPRLAKIVNGDPGRYAALIGVDAYRHRAVTVVVNRGAVLVKAPPETGTPAEPWARAAAG